MLGVLTETQNNSIRTSSDQYYVWDVDDEDVCKGVGTHREQVKRTRYMACDGFEVSLCEPTRPSFASSISASMKE
ncbi:hypothetical protein KC19_VG260900 [Ceratodon purpureus]|uniref:Uncharacterized protein n=1 Tax=Ceratodon purpureus TaxID=3225 RepID=A0A8T0HTQ9_CERPU|nr:hypothetical protein KC19_VG260900 [Ceratodon purpureus]